MQTIPPYTLTNESITVIHNGKTFVVRKGMPNYQPLRLAILNENWGSVPDHLESKSSLQKWVKGLFTLDGDVFQYAGKPIPEEMNSRIVAMATAGEDPGHVLKFYEKLQKNPSFRSVQQLWNFLAQKGIPITPDGTFLAYKSVRGDYKDHHSGTHDNHPGVVNEMPRNEISDDPDVACHIGFHVGSLEYARTFSSASDARMVVCEVDPENVVSVPKDHSAQKMRVCKYKVKGVHNGVHMPDTSFDPDEGMEADVGEHTGCSGDGGDIEPNDFITSDDDQGDEEPKRKAVKGWARFDKMDLEQLMDEPIEDLRRYAAIGLRIVGASKIPGGKVSLVDRILNVRE